jgi:Flp pilus assembly protein TadD
LVKFLLILGGLIMTTFILAFLIVWLSYAPSTSEAITPEQANRIERAEELTGEGWSLWQQRKLSEAATKFQEATALDPEAANAWNGLGWASFNSGQTDQAIAAFEKAVELEPGHPAALNGLGQAYLGYGDLKRAEKYLLKAAPQASAAAYGLGRLYLLTGKYAAAQKWLRKAQGDQPDDPMLQQMIDAAKAKSLPAELRRQIEPVGKPENSDSASATAEGWQHFNQGKLRSAEISFRKALAKDPQDAAALNGLGFCLLSSGK